RGFEQARSRRRLHEEDVHRDDRGRPRIGPGSRNRGSRGVRQGRSRSVRDGWIERSVLLHLLQGGRVSRRGLALRWSRRSPGIGHAAPEDADTAPTDRPLLDSGGPDEGRGRRMFVAKKPRTIDEYLAGVTAENRAALEKVRRAVHTAAPKAEEC